MHWSGKRNTYLCEGENKCSCCNALPWRPGFTAFLIYLVQIVIIGFIGSLTGAILGTVIQQFLPVVLKDFLPIDIATQISWKAILQGLILGVVISFLFALLPLISIRNVSPLNTLRLSFQPLSLFKDPIKWLIYGIILLFIFSFSYLQLNSWKQAAFLLPE
ncbi:MAG: FtsX-like permease family protein [Chitinophagaceae bacterium]